MKKFKVENALRTADMIEATEHTDITDNYVGDYIEADTAEEAIEIAMDYIAERIHANTVMTGNSVLVYNDDDEIVEEYYKFTATEMHWYAVVTDNDPDWGYGSYDRDEALKMAKECAESGTYSRVDIVTIEEGNDPVAVAEETIYEE